MGNCTKNTATAKFEIKIQGSGTIRSLKESLQDILNNLEDDCLSSLEDGQTSQYENFELTCDIDHIDE